MSITFSKFRSGDQAAFKHIYNMFFKPLSSYCYKIVGDVELTNDLVQECFVVLWNKRQEFESVESVRYFLYTSLRNRCINQMKHKKITDSYQQQTFKEDNSIDLNNDYLDLIIEEEARRQLKEAIDSLPESNRKVILLSLKDKQNQEIASILGLSVNTVRNQKQRGYDLLRKKLSPTHIFFL